MLSEDGYIIQETLHLVFTHIDSTVDGVGENVTALLNTMFKVTSFLSCHASDLEMKENGKLFTNSEEIILWNISIKRLIKSIILV